MKRLKMGRVRSTVMMLTVLLLLSACRQELWNNPYPAGQSDQSILYSSFSERPKHLDPAQAYSENEYRFLAQIYAPPLQYHYLKRPYQLTPFAAAQMPTVTYLDARKQPLPEDAPASAVAFSRYQVKLRTDMRYQPHPAFARDEQGNPRYIPLSATQLEDKYGLDDFEYAGTRTVVAADYVHQIKRLAHPRLHTPIQGIMSEYIVGLQDFSRQLQQLNRQQPDQPLDLTQHHISGVRVIDDHTFEIDIIGKYPQFKYWLAMPFFAPMPPEAERFYQQPGMKQRNLVLDWWPVGSGPYYLTENNPNQRMVLSRNPHYFSEFYPTQGEAGDQRAGLLEDAGRSLPLIDRVVYSLEKETIPAWNKFLQGYYDASGISSDSFDQAVQIEAGGEATLTDDMKQKGIRLSTAVSASTMYNGFNMLDDVVGGRSERARKLRLAIAIAIDFEEFISIFANGRGVVAHSPIPPGLFGYREGRAGINPYVYDWKHGQAVRKPVSEARRLLAEAGYPDGIDTRTGQPLVIHLDTTSGGLGSKARLDWLRKQFAKINVQLNVRSTDYNRFQEKIRQGTAQMFYYGWNADYPDPENFLFLLHGKQAEVAHGGSNAANYSNPEYDQLFEQMKNMDNTPRRQQLIDQMLQILQHDSPWLWGFHPKNFVLHHGWLENVKPNVMANNSLKYWDINVAQRQQLRQQWNQPHLLPLWIIAALVVLLLAGLAYQLKRREQAR